MRRPSLALWVLVLALAACTDRALGIFDPGDPGNQGATRDGGGADQRGPMAPGGLPQIYCERMVVLAEDGGLALFDPVGLGFQDLGRLACPAKGGSGPYSIALDRDGVLWVAYPGGELFTADVQTGSCVSSPIEVEQDSNRRFDMTFAPDDSAGGQERLFVITLEDATHARLAKIHPQTHALTEVGLLKQSAELTATDAGVLWGLFRSAAPHAAIIDKASGELSNDLRLGGPIGDISGSGVAFSWFLGQLYVFIWPQSSTSAVFRVDPSSGATERIVAKSGRNLISATAARCF